MSTNPHLSILVYRGAPTDTQIHRHTALWIQFPNGEEHLMHVVGTTGALVFTVDPTTGPYTCPKFAQSISVARLTQPATLDQLEEVLKGVPIRNGDADFNCHEWVNGSLKALVREELLRDCEREKAWKKAFLAITESEGPDD